MISRLALVVVALLLLSSCGFHLRGSEALPEGLEQIYVEASRHSPFRYELINQLEAAGVGLVGESEAKATLTVHSDRIRSRILSVDAQGRAREYALTLIVKYSLQLADSDKAGEPHTARVERDYSFDPDNILAKGGEQARLEQEMRQFAAQQIVRRLRILAKSAQ